MSPRWCRQALAAISLAFAFVTLTATPAAAHGGGHEPGSTNYSTTINDPGITGLEWNVVGGDAYVELTNNTDEQVVILGYQSEPSSACD